jgi:hypothetical protein
VDDPHTTPPFLVRGNLNYEYLPDDPEEEGFCTRDEAEAYAALLTKAGAPDAEIIEVAEYRDGCDDPACESCYPQVDGA